jgi:phosphoribosyl 1,2-cyclic phosphate phosphodiesterase
MVRPADHFDAGVIKRIADARKGTRLNLWSTPQTLAKMPSGCCVPHALTSGDTFSIGALRFTALVANHVLEDLREEAFHYLVEAPDGNLLYALDGAWMNSTTAIRLKGKKLRMIVWDATVEKCGDWRFADHNDLEMIRLMKMGLDRLGITDSSTKIVLDHLARTLWPADIEEMTAAASRIGGILAADGMTITL